MDFAVVGEEFHRFTDRHLQHVVNGLAFPRDFEAFPGVPLAFTVVAGDPYVWKEVHLEFDRASALARLAAATFHVEREGPRRVPTLLGQGGLGEEASNLIEDLRVGGWIGAGRATDGRLIDDDGFVHFFESFDGLVLPRHGFCVVQVPLQGRGEDA